MGKPVVALRVKDAEADPRRGYGEHPYITWAKDEPIVRIAWWSSLPDGAAVRVALKDEHGSVWKELSARAASGLNVLEYDLSADPARVGAAEAIARTRALEKQQSARAATPAPTVPPEPEDEGDEQAEDDEEEDAPLAAASGRPMLDADLQQLLADPLHVSRKRYLPAGTYTVEIAAGREVDRTTLRVKPAKKDRDDEDVGERY
jgi:hypothetical protein